VKSRIEARGVGSTFQAGANNPGLGNAPIRTKIAFDGKAFREGLLDEGIPLAGATLGGALGGQVAATFIAGSTLRGLPTLTGFTRTFAMAALVLAGCAAAGLLIPGRALAAAPEEVRVG